MKKGFFLLLFVILFYNILDSKVVRVREMMKRKEKAEEDGFSYNLTKFFAGNLSAKRDDEKLFFK